MRRAHFVKCYLLRYTRRLLIHSNIKRFNIIIRGVKCRMQRYLHILFPLATRKNPKLKYLYHSFIRFKNKIQTTQTLRAVKRSIRRKGKLD
jgi:hypothetical protein